jgi:hypothetical protein
MALQTKERMTQKYGFQNLIYHNFVGAPGVGIGPLLGARLHRTTQKTPVPEVHIQTAEPYVRAVEDRRLGHRDRHKTDIAVRHNRRGYTAVRRSSFECLEKANMRTVNHRSN